MKTAMKMMLATRVNEPNSRSGEERGETRAGYAESRYMPARNNYDAPHNIGYMDRQYGAAEAERYGGRMEHDNEMESRSRDRRGREHYDNGRFAPMRGEGDTTVTSHYGAHHPVTPPVYQKANPIGFSIDGQMSDNVVPIRSRQHNTDDEELTEETAEMLAAHMENEDGTHGPHWTYDQVKNIIGQKGIQADPAEFFLAMNMMYSDYCKVAKKMNINTVDFYSGMAKAFLDDKDGGKNKLMKYFRYVVE